MSKEYGIHKLQTRELAALNFGFVSQSMQAPDPEGDHHYRGMASYIVGAGHGELIDVLAGHLSQRLLWPWQKPVYGAPASQCMQTLVNQPNKMKEVPERQRHKTIRATPHSSKVILIQSAIPCEAACPEQNAIGRGRHPLIRPWNCCARRPNFAPNGLKHSMTCRRSRTRPRKKL